MIRRFAVLVTRSRVSMVRALTLMARAGTPPGTEVLSMPPKEVGEFLR